jgi:hypothetical protein
MSKIIQIKDVPDDVHATLVQRAAAAGQSLLAYLTSEACQPSLDEVLDRAGGAVSAAFAAEVIRAHRERGVA